MLTHRLIVCLDVRGGRVVKGIRFETLDRICSVLECQPGDILEWRDERSAGT